MLKRFVTDRSGASAVEYGLIAVLIVMGIAGGMTTFSNSFNNLFTNTSGSFQRTVNGIN